MSTARIAAARALLAIPEQRTTLATAIDVTRAALTDSRDRALALELAAGGLRWQSALDRIITQASRRSIREIDPTALVVLRTGVYQLRYLTRVPAHAVVSESVDTVRALGAPRAAGFVNAVLRTVIRRGPTLNLPAMPSADAPRQAQLSHLSTTLSHPLWLVERWLDRYGFDATRAICTWNNTVPTVTVRAAAGQSIEDIATECRRLELPIAEAPFVDDALRLAPGTLGRLEPAIAERLRIHDEGAQLVARAAGVVAGERVLDLCASPGGKTLVLANDLGDALQPAQLVAADHRSARVALLARTLRASDVPATVVQLDAREPLPFAPVFDCVLVDAPCSGLGTLARDPDIKWSRKAADLPELVRTAVSILGHAAEVVRPGGRLVYATCSSEPEENDQVVDALLARDARYEPAGLGPRVPQVLAGVDGRLRTRPDLHNLGAYFAAVLRRRQGA